MFAERSLVETLVEWIGGLFDDVFEREGIRALVDEERGKVLMERGEEHSVYRR